MIFRISKRDEFAQIDKRILADVRLSWKAKGILSYLLGHPNDWEVRTKDLERRSIDGRDSVLSGLKELKKLGYAALVTVRIKGKIVGKSYEIRDVPETGFPDQAKPTQAKPTTENPTYTKNKGTKNKRTLPDASRDRGSVWDLSLNGHTSNKDMPPIIQKWAELSINEKWHVLHFNPITKETTYRKGISKGQWSRQTLESWRRLYLKMDPVKTEKVLNWFIRHFRDRYCPKARTFKSFFDKFDDIAAARKRSLEAGEDNGSGSSKSKVASIYGESGAPEADDDVDAAYQRQLEKEEDEYD